MLVLVHDTARAVARVRQAQAALQVASDAARAAALTPIAARLITPPIRYSAPGLQSHVTYLYSATAGADQPIGRDARDRYADLRKQVDAVTADLDKVLGAAQIATSPGAAGTFENRDGTGR